jgi:hypothetical protein
MKRLAPTLGLALVLASTASAEQFYKWQDETGSWHYATTPPKDKQAQAVVVNAGTGVTRTVQTEGEGAAQAAATDAATPKPGETVVATGETAKQLAEAAKAKRANCERARTNVATIESYTSVTLEREGKTVTLSEDERAAELKRARQQVDSFCK